MARGPAPVSLGSWNQPSVRGASIAYTWLQVRKGDKGGALYVPFGQIKGDMLVEFSEKWSEARGACIVFNSSNFVVRYHSFYSAANDIALEEFHRGWAKANAP